jgi:tetratricopeptide (TPR) repeat protein
VSPTRASQERDEDVDVAGRGATHPEGGTEHQQIAHLVAGSKRRERRGRDVEPLQGFHLPNFASKNNLGRALTIAEETFGREHPAVASVLVNLGSLLSSLKDRPGVRENLERALRILETTLGRAHPRTIVAANNLALSLLDFGEKDQARAPLERNVSLARETLGADHPDYARRLASLSHLKLFYDDDPSAALALARESLRILEAAYGERHPEVAGALFSLALIHGRLGNVTESVEASLRFARIQQEHLQLAALGMPERQALEFAASRFHALDLALSLIARGKSRAVGDVYDAVIRSRALVLDEMAARRRFVSAAPSEEVARRAEAARAAAGRLSYLMVRGHGGDPPAVYRRLVEQAREEHQGAERALAEVSAGFRERLLEGQAGIDDVRRSLPPGTALLAYVAYRHNARYPPEDPGHIVGMEAGARGAEDDPDTSPWWYMGFVLPAGGGGPFAEPLGPKEEIDILVERWRSALARGALVPEALSAQAEESCRFLGEAVRGKVWDPAAPRLAGARTVFIVPDGGLNLVNFAALPVPGGRYLLEAGPLLHLLSTEREIAAPAGPGPGGSGILALGGPAFDDAAVLSASASRAESGPALGAVAQPGSGPVAGGTAGTVPMASARPAASSRRSMTFQGQRSACDAFDLVRFDQLPGAAAEIREIESLWRKAASRERAGGPTGDRVPTRPGSGEALKLTGSGATEAALKAEAPGRRVLHVATHGFFLDGRCPSALDPIPSRSIGGLVEVGAPPAPETRPGGENPLLLSGLALAGANHRSSARPDGEDGILTAEEIAALDLSGVEWAVLSACDTGVGDVRTGEGVFGLRRAFRIAGARTLIMSLWPVEDDSTRDWMRGLYQARLLRGLDAAHAVREAALGVLQGRRRAGRSTHPFYWAAFVAAGDWR